MKVGQFLIWCFAIFCWTSIACFAQSTKGWMVQYDVDVLKSMGIEYKKPDGFKQVPGRLECFKSMPKLGLIIGCTSNQLHSRDGEFIAFISIYKPLTEDQVRFIKKIAPNGPFKGVDRVHEGNIRAQVGHSLGKEAAQNWRKHVHYYPSRRTRRIFNADTAISYSIELDPQDYYKGKYNHLDILHLQKTGRGFVSFYCFYTDKAKRNFSSYWKAIEGVFRYREYAPMNVMNDSLKYIIIAPPRH